MARTVQLFVSLTLIIGVPAAARAQGCPGSPEQSTGPDVIVGTLSESQDLQNYTGSGGLDALSVGTTSCNLGNQDLLWEAAPDTDHPVISQNLFRLKNVDGAGRFEQIGMSWLKHGFAALTDPACCFNCQDPNDFAKLGVGCSDPYTASRNGGQFNAGPRWQVNATTGIHIQPQANPAFSGAMARRLQVHLSDLEESTTLDSETKYFVEGQYVAADDAAFGNKNNNASYRRVSVTQSSPTDFAFGLFGSNPTVETRRQKQGIRAWRDHNPSVVETEVITPEDANPNPNLMFGLVIIAATATDLRDGTWRYEYAIQNMNSDRSIHSFTVPVHPLINVTNIGFHDVDYHDGDGEGSINRDGTDWPGVRNSADVTWACTQTFAQNSNANALRWGTLYNFRFDADAPPDAIVRPVSLAQFKTPDVIVTETVVPGCGCPGDVDGSQTIDGHDIGPFAQMYIQNIPVSNCADVAAPASDTLDDNDIASFAAMLLAGASCN